MRTLLGLCHVQQYMMVAFGGTRGEEAGVAQPQEGPGSFVLKMT